LLAALPRVILPCSYFKESGVPERHIHQQGSMQWEYNDWLAALCGTDVPSSPSWRMQLWQEVKEMKKKYSPDEYRDKWDNMQSVQAAYATFALLKAPATIP
jgi:hypothetical protein